MTVSTISQGVRVCYPDSVVYEDGNNNRHLQIPGAPVAREVRPMPLMALKPAPPPGFTGG